MVVPAAPRGPRRRRRNNAREMIAPRVSVALCGLGPGGPGGGDVRAQIAWARARGAAAVHLDATAPGVRPRDLDRSARRDLASLLRRGGLALGGVDLWIPPEHFVEPARADRAAAALLGAIDLAAEIADLTGDRKRVARVGVVFPQHLPADARALFADRADRARACVADHAPRASENSAGARGPLGVGIDPAACLADGVDPAGAALRAGGALHAARLSDVSRIAGGGRAVPGSGEGRLDVLAYTVALATAGFDGTPAIDVRGLSDPRAAVETTMAALARNALA